MRLLILYFWKTLPLIQKSSQDEFPYRHLLPQALFLGLFSSLQNFSFGWHGIKCVQLKQVKFKIGAQTINEIKIPPKKERGFLICTHKQKLTSKIEPQLAKVPPNLRNFVFGEKNMNIVACTGDQTSNVCSFASDHISSKTKIISNLPICSVHLPALIVP